MQELHKDDWKALVYWEIKEDDWEITSQMLTEEPPVITDDVWLNEEGLWSAKVPGTKDVIGTTFLEKHYAKKALKEMLQE